MTTRLRSSSPRLWGWPVRGVRVLPDDREFPTPVGMARTAHPHCRCPSRVPHACGDGPGTPFAEYWPEPSSPRLWGWPVRPYAPAPRHLEFPTPVGMARAAGRRGLGPAGVPHACGDGPAIDAGIDPFSGSSPRLWGWPASGPLAGVAGSEFPTPVGMARTSRSTPRCPCGVPHACGDGPVWFMSSRHCFRSSPRLWGWPAGAR